MVLAGVILVLILVIIYLATHLTRHASKAQRHWLSLPSHFTIPILSPFTSVVSLRVYNLVVMMLSPSQVEQETSVFSTRVIGIITVVLGVLAYFIFRHWFNSGRTRPT
jgi:hypothetical protein